MTRFSRQILLAALLAAVAVLGAACNGEPAPTDGRTDGPTDGAAASALKGVLIADEPAGAVSVTEAKKSAKEGDEITVVGRVGGALDVFVEGRAVMTIADLDTITSCADMEEDDHCPTPWDYCCEPPKQIVASTATVQVKGADALVLRADMAKDAGIAPLQVVVIRGVVGPRPDPAVLVIDATAIHVRP